MVMVMVDSVSIGGIVLRMAAAWGLEQTSRRHGGASWGVDNVAHGHLPCTTTLIDSWLGDGSSR